MKRSEFPIHTLKENPKDATLPSHQLMIRAGLMQQLSSGLYTYLPLAVRVIRRIEAIVRKHIEKAGSVEILMPILQPAELWQKTGRWETYGAELFKLEDRHNNALCLGATHEEVIVETMRAYIKSYKHLPANLYQINTKFRDEIRPRFGLMRTREFIMKDAYSFHKNDACLEETYQSMKQAYHHIFTEIGVPFCAVQADSGSIGGDVSCEFHILANNGEDTLAIQKNGPYAANIETTPLSNIITEPMAAMAALQKKHTPTTHTPTQAAELFETPLSNVIKTVIFEDTQQQPYAFALQAHHEINLLKINKITGQTLRPVSQANIHKLTNCQHHWVGPINCNMPLFVDYDALHISAFACPASENEHYFQNANWTRDVKKFTPADIRCAIEGDPTPDGTGTITIQKGIEVGHIFQLQSKYTDALKMHYINPQSKSQSVLMGCYGIGISRIMAAVVEHSHDGRGIIWPKSIAPFDLQLVGINAHKSVRLQKKMAQIYNALSAMGISVLWDDLPNRPGFAFSDADLIGIPNRLVMSEGNLDENVVEYQKRSALKTDEPTLIPLEKLNDVIMQYVQ